MINIKKGKTFGRVLWPTTLPFIFKSITGITKAAPVVVTAPAHGLVDGQYVAVISVKGMLQINAKLDPRSNRPMLDQYLKATRINADTISFDIDSTLFAVYVSGGELCYPTPLDMAGCTAARSYKDHVGGTELLRLDTTSGLVIDNTNHTITETISAAQTAALVWETAVTDMTLTNGASVTLIGVQEDVIAVEGVTE
jgi:hypothetical protein